MPEPIEACPGCGIQLPAVSGPTHPYMLGSAACWRGYGELLAAQYADPRRMPFHQLVVDAYAAQHPGGEDRRAVQSVAVHLMTLALFLERDVDPAAGASLHKKMVARPDFHYLPRPEAPPGSMLNFAHVPLDGDPELARARSYEWGRSVWDWWGPGQETVRGWLAVAELG